MLKHLTIKNYALIQNLEIEPSAALNVVTGETGAGKSVMLGALGLLLGNRADTKVLLNEMEKCVTEATFEISGYRLNNVFRELDLDYADITVLRREIGNTGKSRAFINDTPVNLNVLKSVGSRLMDIHSQHETLELGQKQFQLNLIDAYCGNEKLKKDYLEAWSDYREKESAYKKLADDALRLREEADYTKFQLNELNVLSLRNDEQSSLEQKVKMGEHAEEIKTKLSQLVGIVRESEQSSITSIIEARNILNSISSFSDNYKNLFQRLESVRLELDDVVAEMEQAMDDVEYNPEQIQSSKERLDSIYRLMKKHSVNSVPELLVIQNNLQSQADKTENLDEDLTLAKKNVEEAIKKVNQSGKSLSETRRKSFASISKQLVKLLNELGIPQAAIEISHQFIEPSSSGIDEIEINFSANKGIAPRPLAEVASGGEFSRLMFSIKYIMAEKTAMPTLILDEIDSGISGEIAISLGRLMKQMSGSHQIIAISHLPQIAAKADTHYMVYKDDRSKQSVSQIKKLEPSERVEEIAKMIGGAKPTAIALENAKELMV